MIKNRFEMALVSCRFIYKRRFHERYKWQNTCRKKFFFVLLFFETKIKERYCYNNITFKDIELKLIGFPLSWHTIQSSTRTKCFALWQHVHCRQATSCSDVTALPPLIPTATTIIVPLEISPAVVYVLN